MKRNLSVRLAQSENEVIQALSLRYDVFNSELKEGLPESADTRLDRDEYDDYCQHLIVIDRDEMDRVVGTYRIMTGKRARASKGFYSSNEFDLSSIHNLKDEVMEIGRSCVHRGYRDGSVINLLWQGLADCIIDMNVRYLMGCASLHSTDPVFASELYAYLKEKNCIMDDKIVKIKPMCGYEIPGFISNYEISDIKSLQKRIPTIIKGYLRAGAKICGLPALDPVFKTVDVFVLFDAEKIAARYNRKFILKKISV